MICKAKQKHELDIQNKIDVERKKFIYIKLSCDFMHNKEIHNHKCISTYTRLTDHYRHLLHFSATFSSHLRLNYMDIVIVTGC